MEFLNRLLLLSVVAGLSLSAADSVVIQWKNASASLPWLSSVSIEAAEGGAAVIAAALPHPGAEYPNGRRVALSATGPKTFRVKLADDYGFTFSTQMLAEHPTLWARDLGIFISTHGDWASTAAERARMQKQVRQSYQPPFLSASEEYFQWSGFTEHEPDDIHRLAWKFVQAKQNWPLAARNIDRISSMPEVDTAYFTKRIPDLKYSMMFFGWPDLNDQFMLFNNGRLGISSQSVGGDPKLFPDTPWQPRAQGFTVQFTGGSTADPRFPEFGDGDVKQTLEDGYRLVTTSRWTESAIHITQTSFAYPLESETIRTGVEPLVAWNRVTLTNSAGRDGTAYLFVEFTDTDRVSYMRPNPLTRLSEIRWRAGGFFLDDRLVAAADSSLDFAEVPTNTGRRLFRAAVPMKAGAAGSYDFGILYRPLPAPRLKDLQAIGFDQAHARMKRYWDEVAARGASITVPDPWLNNLYRTFLPRVLQCSHLELGGMPVLHVSPIFYSRVWSHITALGIAGDLARRGQFELCRKYLESLFRWQDTPAPESPDVHDWKGFFGIPAIQAPMVWLPFHGRVIWAAARYFQLSGDRAWLDQKLPALLAAMEWISKARASTKRRNPDGTRPLNYGWIPPGRISDGKSAGAHGTSIFTDSNMWLGMETMTEVLEQIGHPQATSWRAESDSYRRDIIDGERRASARRPLMRLNDGTWVPYLPAHLEGDSIEYNIKYVNVVDGPWAMGIMDTSIYPMNAPEAQWVLNLFEDNFSPLNPSLPDEPFSVAGLGQYLHRDQVPNYLYTFYSQSTNTMARQTLTTFEHRSWGQKRVFDLAPWAAGLWTLNFTNLLCHTTGQQLWLLPAAPRRWFSDGQSIEVKGLQTEFGPITFTTHSALAKGSIEARVKLAARRPPARLRIRFRAPEGKIMRSVTVNGQPWHEFDPKGEWINLPGSMKEATIVARY